MSWEVRGDQGHEVLLRTSPVERVSFHEVERVATRPPPDHYATTRNARAPRSGSPAHDGCRDADHLGGQQHGHDGPALPQHVVDMDYVQLGPPMVAVQDEAGQWRLWLASDLDA